MSGQVQLTFEQKQQLCKLKKNNAKLTHANLIEKAEDIFKRKPSMSQITRRLKAKETFLAINPIIGKGVTSFYEVPISD